MQLGQGQRQHAHTRIFEPGIEGALIIHPVKATIGAKATRLLTGVLNPQSAIKLYSHTPIKMDNPHDRRLERRHGNGK